MASICDDDELEDKNVFVNNIKYCKYTKPINPETVIIYIYPITFSSIFTELLIKVIIIIPTIIHNLIK